MKRGQHTRFTNQDELLQGEYASQSNTRSIKKQINTRGYIVPFSLICLFISPQQLFPFRIVSYYIHSPVDI